MFTGLIEEIGLIQTLEKKSSTHQYRIEATEDFIAGVQKGDSVAVSGVCLTAFSIDKNSFLVDVSEETQKRTLFGHSIRNNRVNLERAVTPNTRMGGHIVSGHVDGIGKIYSRVDKENETLLSIKISKDLIKFLAIKGSICLDGISLTINDAHDDLFEVTIIPHTLNNTTLKYIQADDKVNLEVDLIARYLEKLALSK